MSPKPDDKVRVLRSGTVSIESRVVNGKLAAYNDTSTVTFKLFGTDEDIRTAFNSALVAYRVKVRGTGVPIVQNRVTGDYTITVENEGKHDVTTLRRVVNKLIEDYKANNKPDELGGNGDTIGDFEETENDSGDNGADDVLEPSGIDNGEDTVYSSDADNVEDANDPDKFDGANVAEDLNGVYRKEEWLIYIDETQFDD